MLKVYRVLKQFTMQGHENAFGVGDEIVLDSGVVGNLLALGYVEEIV